MRVRSWFVGFTGTVMAAAAVLWACGGTESTSTPVDSGTDTGPVTPTDSGPKDASGQGQVDSGFDAGCDLDADFTEQIPDAAIPDSGTTTGLCLACGNEKCTQQIDACNADCSCKTVADKAIICYAKSGGQIGASFITCLGGIPKNYQTAASLLTCLRDKCPSECAADQVDAGQ